MAFAWAPNEEAMHEPPNAGGERRRRRREHMFDKVVTPSDVGRLNRLVVPKYFAEKYFPLGPASAPAGAVLCFEEEAPAGGGGGGRLWRFRYSYWSSSQSYVMTKGWSRFVREKRLAAGDTVSFGRELCSGGGARFFIGWRRRRAAAAVPAVLAPQAQLLVVQVGGGEAAAAGERVRSLRLFGVDLELQAEPLLLDLQL